MMIDALKTEGVQGKTLLDIGGGIGAIQHELLEAGVPTATDVDASNAYIRAARQESVRRGTGDRVSYQHGNFVDLAEKIQPADIVTLDRVICCYPDMEKLVSLSAARARKLYSLVYPRDDGWWRRAGFAVLNAIFRLQKNPFRIFQHPTQTVEALVSQFGFRKSFYRRTFLWQVVVFSIG
jgi:magnesium-protoporphyrin O-methyltransferase